MKLDEIEEALYGFRHARRRAMWRQVRRAAVFGAIAAIVVLTIGAFLGVW